MRDWIEVREPASWNDADLLAFFGHRQPVDAEALRAAIDHKRRHWRHQESGRNPKGRRIAADVLATIDRAGRRLGQAHGMAHDDWRHQRMPASTRRHDLLAYFGVMAPSDLVDLDARIEYKREVWRDRDAPEAQTVLDEIDDAAALLRRSAWVDDSIPVSMGRAELLAFFGLTGTADRGRLRRHIDLKREQWRSLQRTSPQPRDRRRAMRTLTEIDRAEVELAPLLSAPRDTRVRHTGRASDGVGLLLGAFVIVWSAAVVITTVTAAGVINVGQIVVIGAAVVAAVLLRPLVTGWVRVGVGACALYLVVWWLLGVVGRVTDPGIAAVPPRLAVTVGLWTVARALRRPPLA